jgi:hypothetical protein
VIPDDVAVLAWSGAMRAWLFEPADGDGGRMSERATTGDDPVEAVARYFSEATELAPKTVYGEVNRRAFDRNHVFVIGSVDDVWTCWQMSSSDMDSDAIRRCSSSTPQEAILACFTELGGVTLHHPQ